MEPQTDLFLGTDFERSSEDGDMPLWFDEEDLLPDL